MRTVLRVDIVVKSDLRLLEKKGLSSDGWLIGKFFLLGSHQSAGGSEDFECVKFAEEFIFGLLIDACEALLLQQVEELV